MEWFRAEWHWFLPLLSGLLLGGLVHSLGERYPPDKRRGKHRVFSGLLKEKGRWNWYRKREILLVKNGATFHFGEGMTPIKFLAVQLMLAMAGFLCGLVQSAALGCVCGLGLFFLPEILMHYLNRRDNERMLPDLRLVYHGLAMQIRAGVYVTDALAEMYGSVREPRFRAALLQIAGDVVMKADLFEALEKFQAGFDNRYIDSLCITVLQAMESGQAVELLGDIAEQVKDMESVVLSKRKGRLDRSLTFYQLGLLTAVLGVALYACVTYMMSAVTLF